jgi:L-ascorbate metabolism protein UlaG (beta-lactamase superfamily)
VCPVTSPTRARGFFLLAGVMPILFLMNRRLFFAALAAVAALGTGGLMTKRANAANRYYQGPASDHFDGRTFFNPDGTPPRQFADLLRWQFGGGRVSWPNGWPSPFPQAKPERRVEGSSLRLTMVGHATMLIQTAGLNILIDPVWSERVSPLSFAGPKRVNPPGIAFSDLPPIDLVLVSHNHYDHLDTATLGRLRQVHDPLVVTPLGNDAIIKAAVPGMRVEARDWGEGVALGDATRIHLEPAHHWSARGLGDRLMALWAAFVIETPAGSIYYAGDTGFHGGRNYRAAAQKYGSFRLALLPVGAYEPRWFMEPQHQNPAEAVQGFRLCNAAFAGGCHWGTFQLTNEGIDEPREALFAELDAQGVPRERFRPLLPGEVWDVPEDERFPT